MATELAVQEAVSVRIRLEGRLEVLESASESLEALEKLVRKHKWPDPELVRMHLQTWESVQPRLAEASEAAQRANCGAFVERVARAKEALERSLQKRFATSAIGRAAGSERLALWKQLLEAMKTPARSEQPLANVSIHSPGWRAWFALQGVSLALLLIPLTITGGLSLALVFAAAAAFHLTSSRVRYRLFADVLVRESNGEPTLHLPLTSFEKGEARAGATLRGLVDVTITLDRDCETLCTQLNELARERETLQLEARALSRFTAPPGRWLAASFERQDLSRREAIGLTMGGLALLCERGLLFVPDSAQAEVRSVLFGTERVQNLREQQRPLQTLPAQLILEHLEQLRRINGVRWCPAGIELSWTWVDQQEVVDLMGGRLVVTVDETSRGELRALWPT